MPPTPDVLTWSYNLASKVVLTILAVGVTALGVAIVLLPFAIGPAPEAAFWTLELSGAVIVGFGVFLVFGLSAVLRTRLTLDRTSLRGLVPNGAGRLLVPRFRAIDVPVAEIRSVERRAEIVKAFGFTTARESLSIVTAGDQRIGLFSNADTSLIRLPLTTIAGAIATAAGVAVTDRGTVLTTAKGLYGEAASSWTEPPLDAAAATRARRATVITLQIIVALMMLTYILRACGS
jgi:hypothetical protein